MKTTIVLAISIVGAASLAASALAEGSFQEHYADCVEKFAPNAAAASVMLECNADGGKLGGCKVIDNSAPGKGFDKAAICVASFLPMGSKTGPVRVPVRFTGA